MVLIRLMGMVTSVAMTTMVIRMILMMLPITVMMGMRMMAMMMSMITDDCGIGGNGCDNSEDDVDTKCAGD